MYVARVPNRGSPPAILLRESYREGGKVKNRTLANLSRWPEHKVDALSRALKGLPPARDLSEAFEITRSLPHGHVAAVLGTAQRLGLPELIDATPSRNRDLVSAMLIAQVIGPGSKLATARGLRTETATSSLGQVLGVSGCDEDDLYAAMDWAAVYAYFHVGYFHVGASGGLLRADVAEVVAIAVFLLIAALAAGLVGQVRSRALEAEERRHETSRAAHPVSELAQQQASLRRVATLVARGARRRFERDLHDGAQQRLVSLGLMLRAVEDSIPSHLPAVKGQVSDIIAGLLAANQELRELSHGLHPTILSRGGLRRRSGASPAGQQCPWSSISMSNGGCLSVSRSRPITSRPKL